MYSKRGRDMVYDDDFKNLCKKLGKHIQKIRLEKGLSVKELSQKSNIRCEYLYKIERGEAYGLKIDGHLYQIADGLQIKLPKLFDFK